MKLHLFFPPLLLFIALHSWASPADEGRQIFTSRCGSCHHVNKLVIGPALAGVDQRHTIDWIVRFVQSSQSLIRDGDKDAAALYEKYRITMPDHSDLTAANIQSIVDYIKSQTVAATEQKAPFARPGKLHPANLPLSGSNYGMLLVYLSGVMLLIVALVFFVNAKERERMKLNDN